MELVRKTSLFQMTPRDALRRQERDVKHYGEIYPGGEEALRAKMKSMTDLTGLNLDENYDIGDVINHRIPRGAAVEFLVYGKVQQYD